ncbi:TIGR04222 domain-containing membrane protein [Amycolatopsis nivea]|uniref:TIGR04222 domain-containing membrane protein n=1 Tax=Amycolatopsis nivea TaxID=1644109 RepID=UPI001070191A|nr:TIGR04222 domain-containing membrane protein [Amycolatopsis nivea]
MHEPWGISGPQFLAVYGSALALTLAVQLVWPLLRQAPADVHRPLDVYQLACLVGGPHRTVDTAIAALLERGLLRVDRRGQLTAVSGAPTEPVEQAVCEAVRKRPHTASMLRTAEAVRSIGNDLRTRGLVTVASASFATGVVLVYVALFAVGLARSVNGSGLHRPTAGLNVLLAITAILAVLAVAGRRRPKVRPTKAGRALVVAVRTDPVTQRAQSGALLFGAASLVALGGFAQYPDHATSLALTSGAGTSSGGGSSCGGGSGCGGGGGCGG